MARSSTSGQGRPKGVPNKATRTVRAIAADLGPGAIATLARIAADSAAPYAARVSACREILDRGFGKASTTLVANIPSGSFSEQGEHVVARAVDGSLPLEHATSLMGLLTAHAKLQETTQLIERLEMIEDMLSNKEVQP